MQKICCIKNFQWKTKREREGKKIRPWEKKEFLRNLLLIFRKLHKVLPSWVLPRALDESCFLLSQAQWLVLAKKGGSWNNSSLSSFSCRVQTDEACFQPSADWQLTALEHFLGSGRWYQTRILEYWTEDKCVSWFRNQAQGFERKLLPRWYRMARKTRYLTKIGRAPDLDILVTVLLPASLFPYCCLWRRELTTDANICSLLHPFSAPHFLLLSKSFVLYIF